MSAERPHRDNSGVLFTNSADWIAKGKDRPRVGGEATIAGKRYRVAGWKHDTDDGRSYLSLEFSEAVAKPAKGGAK